MRHVAIGSHLAVGYRPLFGQYVQTVHIDSLARDTVCNVGFIISPRIR